MADDDVVDDEPDETEDIPAGRADIEIRARLERRAAKREFFLRAGLDPDSPRGQLAYTGYRGELTPDAFHTWMHDVFGEGGPRPAEPAATSPPPIDSAQPPGPDVRDDLELSRRRLGLGVVGAETAEPPEDHPHVEAIRQFNEARAQGRTRQQASEKAVSHLFYKAYGEKDRRVIYRPPANVPAVEYPGS